MKARPTRARQQIAGACSICIIAAAAILLGTQASGAATRKRPRRGAHSATVPSSQFAVLSDDTQVPWPAELEHAVDAAPVRFGLSLSGARQSSTGAWVIPGNGWMCVGTEDTEGFGLSCSTAADAASGKLAFVQRSASSGVVTVVGAVPNDILGVTAVNADGVGIATAPVIENTYRLRGTDIGRVRLETPNSLQSVELAG